MIWERNSDLSYSVRGYGPLRPIIVEGATREEARQKWMSVYGDQYAEQETATAWSMFWEVE
jgi:hypothetical protein